MRGTTVWVCASLALVLAACSGRVRGGAGGSGPSGPLDFAVNDGPLPLDFSSAAPLDFSMPDAAVHDFAVVPGTPGHVYAHSFTELYRVDTATLQTTSLGPFVDTSLVPVTGGVQDIAIDQHGTMIAMGNRPGGPAPYSPLYAIDFTSMPGKAVCRTIPTSMDAVANGLTFVPAGMLDPSAEVLLASGTNWWRIDLDPTMTFGTVTILGSLPSAWMSVGGDSVGIIGDAVYTTARPAAGGNSHLLVLQPSTMTVVDRGDTGQEAFWGLAYWGGTLYAFAYGPVNPPYGGKLFTLDPLTAQATAITTMPQPAPQWFGAAVRTSAPRQ